MDIADAELHDAVLQWSHVLTNVETREEAEGREHERIRFNGATSSRTWKLSSLSGVNASSPLLQWSHVLTNVETRV